MKDMSSSEDGGRRVHDMATLWASYTGEGHGVFHIVGLRKYFSLSFGFCYVSRGLPDSLLSAGNVLFLNQPRILFIIVIIIIRILFIIIIIIIRILFIIIIIRILFIIIIIRILRIIILIL